MKANPTKVNEIDNDQKTEKETVAFATSFTKSRQSRVVGKVPFIETNLFEVKEAPPHSSEIGSNEGKS